jgi:hypothetical protein
MTLQDLIQQVNELPINDRWELVMSALASIRQETQVEKPRTPEVKVDSPQQKDLSGRSPL